MGCGATIPIRPLQSSRASSPNRIPSSRSCSRCLRRALEAACDIRCHRRGSGSRCRADRPAAQTASDPLRPAGLPSPASASRLCMDRPAVAEVAAIIGACWLGVGITAPASRLALSCVAWAMACKVAVRTGRASGACQSIRRPIDRATRSAAVFATPRSPEARLRPAKASRRALLARSASTCAVGNGARAFARVTWSCGGWAFDRRTGRSSCTSRRAASAAPGTMRTASSALRRSR